jgi:threonine-phosphate decarboxylase
VKVPLHGGEVFSAARRLGVPVSSLVDFSASINPLGPSPNALRRLRTELSLIRHYPDSDQQELRDLVAQTENIHPQCILFGNGATQLLHLMARLLKPRKALIVEPGFAEYATALGAVGCRIHRLQLQPETSFRLERTKLFDIIGRKLPDLILLGNPNNPTGVAIPSTLLAELRDRCAKQHIHLVLDESFIDFTFEPSLLQEASRRPYLFVVRSLTKFWALAGLRLGYVAAQAPLVEKLKANIEPWSVNTLALAAAAASLRDSKYRPKTLALLRKERAFLHEQLSKLGWLKPCPSVANFLLVRITAAGISSTDLQRRLEDRDILIRDGSNFPGLGRSYIRVAIRSRPENSRLIEELRSIGYPPRCSDEAGR